MPANVSSNIPREIFVSVDVTSSAGTSEGSILSLQGDSTAQTGPSRAAEQTYLLYNVQTLWFDDIQARNTGTNAGLIASRRITDYPARAGHMNWLPPNRQFETI